MNDESFRSIDTLAEPAAIADFGACRTRFLQIARSRGAHVDTYRHPGRGPLNEVLACDVARFGPKNASRALFVASGTHGLEGPAGSAVQFGWMASDAPLRLPHDLAVFLIHAVNPFGFAFGRRNDAENVDPNRNFIVGEGGFPPNPGYRELHALLCPPDWHDKTLEQINGRLDEYSALHGFEKMKSALAAGQSEFPDGLFYCGDHETWPVSTSKRILDAISPETHSLAYIDLHTGLGAFAEPVYLCFHAPDSPARARAKRWFGADAIEPKVRAEGQLEHYEGLMYGGIEHYLAGLETTIVCVEFGTQPPMSILGALLLEHWLHFHGGKQRPENREYVRHVRECFLPSEPHWTANIVASGVNTIDRAVAGLASESD